MPRRFAFFDYKIPEGLDIHIGDLVIAPLKGRPVSGIVRYVSGKTEFDKLHLIETVLKPGLMSVEDIERLELIAEQILQSPATVFASTLQGITHSKSTEQKTHDAKSGSIDKATAEVIRSAVEQKNASIETSLEGSITAMRLAIQKSKNQILILCPRERDVEIISEFLPIQHARLHGHTSKAKRKWILENWRSGDLKVLIGTRQASLIPAQSIETIFIFDPHSEDHVSYSRNPRYDARLAAKLLAKQHNASIISCGPLRMVKSDCSIHTTPKALCQIIDLSDKQQKTGIPLVSETLLESISDSLQNGQPVLISYNCKGVARHLQCRSCHHTPMCGTCGSQPHVRLKDLVCPVCNTEMWIPKNCPGCGKATLSTRGIGNKKIAAELTKHFPKAKIEIIDKEHSQESNADIQIVTEHYFQSVYQPFASKRFGLIAELMVEKSLGSDYESSIITAYRMHRLLHMAHHHKSQCIVQTWMPSIIKPMLEPKTFIKSESELRKKYKLPPFADQFELSGKTDQISEDIRSNCIDQDGKLLLTTDPEDRNSIIKKLKELPDSVTILTKYKSYDPTNHHNS